MRRNATDMSPTHSCRPRWIQRQTKPPRITHAIDYVVHYAAFCIDGFRKEDIMEDLSKNFNGLKETVEQMEGNCVCGAVCACLQLNVPTAGESSDSIYWISASINVIA